MTTTVIDDRRWRVPLLWRVALPLSRVAVFPFCRLRITGTVPAELRRGPLILAVNHVGSFDPFALSAACAKARLAPRIMATGGLFRAPVVGPLMRWAGHIRVDRRRANVTDALAHGVAALQQGSVVLAYPEGRITLDPGMWPERGKTGLARLAVATGVPVVPVSQWGAHLVLPWGSPHGSTGRLLWSLVHRPVVQVHFGEPLSFSPDDASPRAVRRATEAIMDEIVAGLVPIRTAEPRLPKWIDPERPLSASRRHIPKPDHTSNADQPPQAGPGGSTEPLPTTDLSRTADAS